MSDFNHEALSLRGNKLLIYTAMSKHNFYYRMFISKFVLEQDCVPLNPFMIFDYFLLDTVPRNIVREANNSLVQNSNELWVFGPISDGVLAEIKIAKELKKTIKYFSIKNSSTILQIEKCDVIFENDLEKFKSLL